MRYIIGIDEVGRGPLAGPVTVCAVLCEENLYKKLKKDKKLPALGKDSKKLSPKQREEYSGIIKEKKIEYPIVHISNKIIDKKGLSFAIKNATEKALNKIIKSLQLSFLYSQGYKNDKKSFSDIYDSKFIILLDGGLRISKEFLQKYPEIKFKQTTIIKGDEKEKIIAWASILAKVSRDKLMNKMHKKYPEYNFHNHKGYGTKSHREAIRKNGLSKIHRSSFCKNFMK